MYGFLEKQSRVITGRNPFKKDECILDYEMDSEDEWAEQHGEDLDKKDVEEELEDEEMANEDEEEVDDDDDSKEKFEFGQEQQQRVQSWNMKGLFLSNW